MKLVQRLFLKQHITEDELSDGNEFLVEKMVYKKYWKGVQLLVF